MTRHRDISAVSLLGTGITGVQRVAIRGEGTALDFSGDGDLGPQDIGLTKRFYTIDVETLHSSKYRDIHNPQFVDKAGTPVTTDLNEVLGVDMALEGDALPDSAEADTWLTYIGVTNVRSSLDLTLRDVDQALEAIASDEMGIRGKVQFNVLPPQSTHGLPDTGSAVQDGLDNLVLVGVEGAGAHRELSQGMLHFQGYGESGDAPEFLGSSIADAVPGDTGTFSATFGGAPTTTLAVTVDNCVCIRTRITVEHGGLLRVSYELQAYSSDGTTDPLSAT